MKKTFVTFIAISLLACNNSKKNGESAEMKANTPANMSGFTPSYSASFVMDDAKNTETVLALWKDWDGGDLSKSRSHFADTISFFFPDGSSMMGPADSVLKNIQQYRSSFKSSNSTVEAIFGVKSTDKNENWVAVWGHEIKTDMQGKTDTVSQQETWRFNKNGKADMMFQASRKGILPPPPAK
jgi:hypothetical protein